MKSAFVWLVILSFLAMGVFGVFVMAHGGEHTYACLSSIAKGAECPAETNLASSLAFHLDVFKSFTTAVFGDALLAMYLAFAALFLLIDFKFLASGEHTLSAVLFSRFKAFFNPLTPVTEQKRLVHWFSLQENSPALS